MEVDANNDGPYSDEDLPMHEPWGKKYLIVKIFKCRAQDEWQLEEWFETYPVAVEGVIYQRGEWLDPGWQSIKDQLHSRVQYPGAGSGWGRSRGGFLSPGGAILDLREVFLAEQDRTRKNKMTRFVFLIEDKTTT